MVCKQRNVRKLSWLQQIFSLLIVAGVKLEGNLRAEAAEDNHLPCRGVHSMASLLFFCLTAAVNILMRQITYRINHQGNKFMATTVT